MPTLCVGANLPTMPIKSPQMSFEFLKNYIEKWQWTDPKTGHRTIGYNAPINAKDKRQVPYHIKYVTLQGNLEEGYCVTLKAFPRRRQHMIMFVESKQIRMINDFLVIEVDGTRFHSA